MPTGFLSCGEGEREREREREREGSYPLKLKKETGSYFCSKP